MLSMLALRSSRSLIGALARAQPFRPCSATEEQASASLDSPCSCSYPTSPAGPFAAFDGQQQRSATKKAGGSASQKQDSHAKNLGVKMLGGELIFPGQIIVRQRGLRYHPGYSVGLGKDHTIFATGAGFVHFHKESVKLGADGQIEKQRMYISVKPVDGIWDKQHRATVEAKMVAQRAIIKREMMRGRPFEPALFYSRTAPAGQPFSWLSRPPPRSKPVAPVAAPPPAATGAAAKQASSTIVSQAPGATAKQPSSTTATQA